MLKIKNLLIVKVVILIAFLSYSFQATAKDNQSRTNYEIKILLEFVQTSQCQFNRNGSWYESVEAAKHINKKYQYALKKGSVETAEDFINYAATKSSFSGKEYTVRCKDGLSLKSAAWLTSELRLLRKNKEKSL